MANRNLTVGAGIALGLAASMVLGRRKQISLAGKTVFVTGGSRGLGLLLALEFATRGAKVAISARDRSELDRAETQLRTVTDQVLALETDMTRIVSFKTGRDAQNRVFPESGSSQPFHPASHHGNREERIMEFNKICKYRVGQLAYFLEKMKESHDAEGSLLDKTLIIWGSPMADPNIHNHRRCPLVLFGHANGALKGNLHVKAADGTPMANVMLTLMHQLGVDDMKSFGDSTGEFSFAAPALTTVAQA